MISLEYIASRVSRHGSCWRWGGAMRKGNTPIAVVRGKEFSVRRAAYLLHRGICLSEKSGQVLATCGNPMCVNPDHAEMVPLGTARARQATTDPRAFIMARIKPGPGRCWNWTSSLEKDGYGRAKFCGAQYPAHRLSYAAHNGLTMEELSATGLFVMHTCDNPSCVNPDHLVLGTAADNMADKVHKGRQSKGAAHSAAVSASAKRGAAHHNTRLSEDQVRWAASVIKGRDREWGLAGVAKKLGVSDFCLTDNLQRLGLQWEGNFRGPDDGAIREAFSKLIPRDKTFGARALAAGLGINENTLHNRFKALGLV